MSNDLEVQNFDEGQESVIEGAGMENPGGIDEQRADFRAAIQETAGPSIDRKMMQADIKGQVEKGQLPDLRSQRMTVSIPDISDFGTFRESIKKNPLNMNEYISLAPLFGILFPYFDEESKNILNELFDPMRKIAGMPKVSFLSASVGEELGTGEIKEPKKIKMFLKLMKSYGNKKILEVFRFLNEIRKNCPSLRSLEGNLNNPAVLNQLNLPSEIVLKFKEEEEGVANRASVEFENMNSLYGEAVNDNQELGVDAGLSVDDGQELGTDEGFAVNDDEELNEEEAV